MVVKNSKEIGFKLMLNKFIHHTNDFRRKRKYKKRVKKYKEKYDHFYEKKWDKKISKDVFMKILKLKDKRFFNRFDTSIKKMPNEIEKDSLILKDQNLITELDISSNLGKYLFSKSKINFNAHNWEPHCHTSFKVDKAPSSKSSLSRLGMLSTLKVSKLELNHVMLNISKHVKFIPLNSLLEKCNN